MTAFDIAYKRLHGIEGRYSDHEADRGGKTTWGITEKVARRYGWDGPMNELPLKLAKDITEKLYWQAMQLDEVYRLCPRTAIRLLDAGFNCGTGTAGVWFQRCLNALNDREKHYRDVVADGVVGAKTLAALSAYRALRKTAADPVLCEAITCLQGHHYIRLAERDASQEAFVFGWFLQRIVPTE